MPQRESVYYEKIGEKQAVVLYDTNETVRWRQPNTVIESGQGNLVLRYQLNAEREGMSEDKNPGWTAPAQAP